MNAIIVTVGDELLIGQVVDTNSTWMGEQLNNIGIKVSEKIAIGDDHDQIIRTLEYASSKAKLILMTGGLGPTKDDITKKAIAAFLGLEMEFHQEMYDRILRVFERWGRSSTPAHREQCYLPKGCVVLRNRMGTAPGMLFEFNGVRLVSMPGVPYEMKSIMNDELLPVLIEENEYAIVHKTIRTVGEGETRIAAKIEHITDRLPQHISIAFLPSLGQVRLRLTGYGKDKVALGQEVGQFVETISFELSTLVFGYDQTTLAEAVGQMYRERGWTIGTAESCTGGNVAHMITLIPGSSDYFNGGIVAYSNDIKERVLNVSTDTLKKYGAVSEQTVIEMVKGAVTALKVDVAVAISGIAGPSGGSEEKPVGTIWLACGNKERVVTKLLNLGKNREKNIEYASGYALAMLKNYLQGS